MKRKAKATTALQAAATPKAPAYDPTIAGVVAYIQPKGTPEDEAGPAAWQHQLLAAGHHPTDDDVIGNAIIQLAKKPAYRHLVGGRNSTPAHRLVFVVADHRLAHEALDAAACRYSRHVGTFTEARRLAAQVRWLWLPYTLTAHDVATMAANEVAEARSEDASLYPEDIVFMVVKNVPESFGASHQLEVAQRICDVVFTTGTDTVPAFIDDDDDDELESWTA